MAHVPVFYLPSRCTSRIVPFRPTDPVSSVHPRKETRSLSIRSRIPCGEREPLPIEPKRWMRSRVVSQTHLDLGRQAQSLPRWDRHHVGEHGGAHAKGRTGERETEGVKEGERARRTWKWALT